MQNLRDQHVLILGLGASGLAMARWCLRCGAQVTVADTRNAPPQLAALQQTCPQARFVPGALTAALLERQNIGAVFKSPGLSRSQVAPVLIAADAAGISTGGELDLFFTALQELREQHAYRPTVLAVTGTNGKTTVTSLTGQLVARAGKTVVCAGNIGPTLLDTLTACLAGAASDVGTKPDRPGLAVDAPATAGGWPEVWVLELSSFQLADAQLCQPDAAVLLNITQDHLDWHGDMAAYTAAKARIFAAQTRMLLNRDDAGVMALLPPPPVPAPRQRPTKAVARALPRPVVCFGAGLPQRPGDWGLESVNGLHWLVRALEADDTGRSRREPDVIDPGALRLQRLLPAQALRIRGLHNAVNALAALALAAAAGCNLAAMLYGLREYRGEPHRVQPVALIGEVEYFDDSKGTNVGATVAALQGLGAERRVLVILGGDGKGQDFAPLAEPVARYVRTVLLIGRDAPLLRAALAGTGVPLLDAPNLTDAVQQCRNQAQAGDAVLLSPACASFDQFRDYEQRAEVFRAAVQALAAEVGQDLQEPA